MAVTRKLPVSKNLVESKWNTRKLVGFAALYLGSLLLCFTDKATGAETYWFWIWLFGIYVTGNIGAKVITPTMIGKLKLKLKRKFKIKKAKKENK